MEADRHRGGTHSPFLPRDVTWPPKSLVWNLRLLHVLLIGKISVTESLPLALCHFFCIAFSLTAIPFERRWRETPPYPRDSRPSPPSQHTRCLTAPSWRPRPGALRTRAERHQRETVNRGRWGAHPPPQNASVRHLSATCVLTRPCNTV